MWLQQLLSGPHSSAVCTSAITYTFQEVNPWSPASWKEARYLSGVLVGHSDISMRLADNRVLPYCCCAETAAYMPGAM